MSFDINFYVEIEKLRKAKGISTEDLCKDIISERTYYRHLNGEVSIRVDTLQEILERLDVNMNELIIQGVRDKSISDPGLSYFVYKMYNLGFSEIKPLYEALRKYKPKNLLTQKFIEVNLYKYRFLTKEISANSYQKILKKIYLVDLKNVRDENIYKLYIDMECFLMDYKSRNIEKVKELVLNADVLKNPLYYIIMYDNFMTVVMKNQLLPIDDLKLLYKKFRSSLHYFNIIRPFSRMDLYRAYLEKYCGTEIMMKKFLIKYINGIIITDGGRFIREELKELEKDFGIVYNEFLTTNRQLMFYNPDSRFRIIKEEDIEHQKLKDDGIKKPRNRK